MNRQRILTGITTTGTPHLGNYVGAIRPALVASQDAQADAFFFMADYHALIKCDDPARVQRSRLEIAATWLACGLDPERTTFYRQSDIPEIPELTWLLTCVTAKGLLNRAHAYKAAVDKNVEADSDADAGINAGLFMYPVLMAADILAFNANTVPVGRDQVQHIEMARVIAQRFNHIYGREFFTLPEAAVEAQVATLPGLDGRKMSKSYDNTIALFEGGSKRLREAILRIVTDSRTPGEPKQAQGTALFALYEAFADAQSCQNFAAALADGLGWGEAKQQVFETIEAQLAPMRERYEALMRDPDSIETILRAGALKARALATPLLATLREAVGLGQGKPVQAATPSKKKAGKGPRIVSFRDEDGSFRFRLLSADGEPLALSPAFADAKAAAVSAQRLRHEGDRVLLESDAASIALILGADTLAHSPAFADAVTLEAGMSALREALAGLANSA